jgi:hypothetical protein
MGVRVGFYLFSEVVNGHQNEFVPVGRFRIDWPYDI